MDRVSRRTSLLHIIKVKRASVPVLRQPFLLAKALISPFVVMFLRHIAPFHAMLFHAMQWGILESAIPTIHLTCRRR